MKKKRILVICTGNSCRSQMAEGFFRYHGGKNIEAYSAGTIPSFVHPLAISVMREKGIDISGHKSESIEKYAPQPFDYVITVCDSAKERCPVFPDRTTMLHWGVPDPVAFFGGGDSVTRYFRKIRSQIEDRIVAFLKNSGWLNNASEINNVPQRRREYKDKGEINNQNT